LDEKINIIINLIKPKESNKSNESNGSNESKENNLV